MRAWLRRRREAKLARLRGEREWTVQALNRTHDKMAGEVWPSFWLVDRYDRLDNRCFELYQQIQKLKRKLL